MSSNVVSGPVAILDKDLARYPSYKIETYELCDCCGARFGICFHQGQRAQGSSAGESARLPNMLRKMLADDHGRERKHKAFTEIWLLSDWDEPVD